MRIRITAVAIAFLASTTFAAQPPTDKEHDPASLKCQSAHTPETPRSKARAGFGPPLGAASRARNREKNG